MSINIEAVTPKVILAEGAFWDISSQNVYYVDAFGKQINRYHPSNKSYCSAVVPVANDKLVTSVVPVEGCDNRFVAGIGNRICKVAWNGTDKRVEKIDTITEINYKVKGSMNYQWNDAKVDFQGNLWIGYFLSDIAKEIYNVDKAGGLFTLMPHKTLKKQLGSISLANGMGWNKSHNKFYFIDSFQDQIWQFDYDPHSSEIFNKQSIFKFGNKKVAGVPDGLAIDVNDNLWIPSFGGGLIINIDPRRPNTVIRSVDMPIREITSVTFGGPNLDELYATTSGIIPKEFQPIEGGRLYRITGIGVKGRTSRRVVI